MTNQKQIEHMDNVVKIFIDSLYEMENLGTNDLGSQDDGRVEGRNRPIPRMNCILKSNSLGLLSVKKYHDEMGTAVLHWEGGFAGERKIQEVKPALYIKRSNVDLPKLTLKKMYQHDALEWLRENANLPKFSQKNRLMDGIVRVYASWHVLETQIKVENKPLSCLIAQDGRRVSIAVRTKKSEHGSNDGSIGLIKLDFDDSKGMFLADMCWVAPIGLSWDSKFYSTMKDLFDGCDYRDSGLLLPTMSPDTKGYENQYCGIGS